MRQIPALLNPTRSLPKVHLKNVWIQHMCTPGSSCDPAGNSTLMDKPDPCLAQISPVIRNWKKKLVGVIVVHSQCCV